MSLRYVYLAHSPETGKYKFGVSRDPWSRAKEISASSPVTVNVIEYQTYQNAERVKRNFQSIFSEKRCDGGDWFDLDPTDISNFYALWDTDADELNLFVETHIEGEGW